MRMSDWSSYVCSADLSRCPDSGPRLRGGDADCFRSKPLDDGNVGLTAAFAHRLQAVFAAGRIEHAEQGRHQLGAAGAERVAERDRAAMLVEPRMIAAEILQPRERHGRERLIDLIGVDVADRHARLLERAFGREQRFFEQIGRVTRGHRDMMDTRAGGQIVILERSEEHTSELQSLMRSSYAVFCFKKKKI